MATQLEATSVDTSGRRRYLWDEWLNGHVWLGHRGVDWVCKDTSFISQLYKAAYERGLLVTVSPKGNGAIEWQSRPAKDDAKSNVA
jgi:hypothetical protein